MNMALCQAGLESPKTSYARYLLAENGGRIISEDEQKTASLLCNAAIEARVLGTSGTRHEHHRLRGPRHHRHHAPLRGL